MKKLFTLCCCTALLLALAGCSKDDDDAIDAAAVVGEWICTYQKIVEKDGSTSLESTYDAADDYRLLLHADGTGMLVTGKSGDSLLEWDSGNQLPLTYSISGNEMHAVIYRHGLSGEGTDEVYKITSLTERTLELVDDQRSYTITCRFVRK